MVFGKKLLALLKQKKMTQKRLADILDVNVQAINRYIKSDRQPRVSFIKKVADTLNVPVTYFVNDYETPETAEKIREQKLDEFVNLKVISQLPAGVKFKDAKQFMDEIFVNKVHLAGGKKVYAVRNVSDDMIPIINQDDIIVVAEDAKLSNGDIVMLRSKKKDGFELREYYNEDGKIFFHTRNPYKDPFIRNESTINKGAKAIQIAGKVVYSCRGY